MGQSPTESIPESKLDQAEAADVKSEKDQGEDRKDEAEYIIPSWAKGPELTLQLKNQSGLDPDRIFGPITPLSLKGKEHCSDVNIETDGNRLLQLKIPL